MKKILLLAAAMLAMNSQAQNVVLSEDFEGEEISWKIVDNDGDGFNWGLGTWSNDTENSTVCAYSQSYDNNSHTALSPDNWLLSPAFDLGANGKLTFDVKGQDPSYCAERYGVYVTENVTAETFNADDYTSVYEGTATANWENIEVDLSAYEGKAIAIALRHWDVSDMFIIRMDNIVVTEYPNTAISDVRVNEQDSNVWFDLQGRRYNERPQTAGIYVNNGKKVVIK